MSISRRPIALHLDGFFDNPEGDFSIERGVFEPHGIDFMAGPEAVARHAAEAEVIFFRAATLDAPTLQRLASCRVAIRYGIGLDKVDLPAASRLGIAVCNVPDFCLQEMADHTMALALYLDRKFAFYQAAAQTGNWELTREEPLPSPAGRIFTTLGFGRIARQVLRRAQVFGYQIAACDPHVDAKEIARFGAVPLSLPEALRTSDLLSLHCPLLPETRGLFNAETLALMKPTTLLINTARGELVDTDALLHALQNKALGGAGLDVTAPEPLPAGHALYGLSNVIITPHVAWYSEASQKRLKQHAAEEGLRALRGEALRYKANPLP